MEAPVPEETTSAKTPRTVKRYAGRVIYIYAFDIAYEMLRQPVSQLLGQPVAQFSVDTSRRNPRHLFYRPQMVRLPPDGTHRAQWPVRVERTFKFLPVGAISITVSVPFEVQAIEDLVAYHDLEFSNGVLSRRCGNWPKRRGASWPAIFSSRSRNWRRRRPTRSFVLTPRWWPRTGGR